MTKLSGKSSRPASHSSLSASPLAPIAVSICPAFSFQHTSFKIRMQKARSSPKPTCHPIAYSYIHCLHISRICNPRSCLYACVKLDWQGMPCLCIFITALQVPTPPSSKTSSEAQAQLTPPFQQQSAPAAPGACRGAAAATVAMQRWTPA